VTNQLEQNYQFFMDSDVGQYSDEWIVIVNGVVVAHSMKLADMLAMIKQKYSDKKPLLYKVPGKESMIF